MKPFRRTVTLTGDEDKNESITSSSYSSNGPPNLVTPKQTRKRKEPEWEGTTSNSSTPSSSTPNGEDVEEDEDKKSESDDSQLDLNKDQLLEFSQRLAEEDRNCNYDSDGGSLLEDVDKDIDIDIDNHNDKKDCNSTKESSTEAEVVQEKRKQNDTKFKITKKFGASKDAPIQVKEASKAYRSKKDDKVTYVVLEFILGTTKRKAKCEKYKKLKHTFVGEKANNITNVMYQYPVEINAWDDLGEECEKPPRASLLYRARSIKASPNISITYIFRNSGIHQNNESPKSLGCGDGQITVLDLFCGAGGMSQGFKKNNFNVIGAVDWNQNAIATFSLNNPGVPIFNEDIRLWFEKVKQGKPGYVFFGVDHIQASPPCQSFSLANIFGGQNDELNKSMTLLLIEIICFIKPKTFSMENVTGLLHPSNVDVLREVAAKLIEFGYDVRIYVLNSSKYGDPQLRHRVFLFAAKRGMPLPNRPIETHGDKFVAKPKYSQEIQVPKPKKEVSSKDALQDLEEIEPESGAGIVHVNGDLVYNHSLATTKLYSERTKLKPNRGAHTVRSTNKFEHYKHNRCLTHRELARLQGFPDSYKFIGSAKEISLQIGNAVPCNTACAVAKAIRDRCYPMMF